MNIEVLRRIKSALTKELIKAIADDVPNDVYEGLILARDEAVEKYNKCLFGSTDTIGEYYDVLLRQCL